MNNETIHSRKLKKLITEDPHEGISRAFDLYGRQVKTICRNMLCGYSEEDIEEAVSQTFISLWTGISRYSPSKGSSIKSYTYGIARKTCLMIRRRDLGKACIPIDESMICLTSPAAEDIFLSDEQERLLHKALEDTDEPARSIFIMRYFYFEKIADIAAKLGISRKKVENTLAREKKKLKAKLQKEGIDK